MAEPRVHPSAVVHPQAHLAEGVVVGPFAVVEEDACIGAGTALLAGTVLLPGSRVGKGCRLGPYATVGGEPMDARFKGERSCAVLEDEVMMRDFASVHRATGEGEETRVGAGTLLMSYSHVSHNVKIGRGCVLTTTVQLGGHCQIGDWATLGAGVMLHQHCRVGAYAMCGAASASNQDILPYSMAQGSPAKHYRLNRVGLRRHGISGETYRLLERAIRAFRRRDWVLLDELAGQSCEVEMMRRFREESGRGICGFI